MSTSTSFSTTTKRSASPTWEIPHPRLRERRFALVPLLEIDPELTDPWETPLADSLDEAEGDVELLEPF